MTKEEATREFKEFVLPQIKRRYEQDGGGRDLIARREAWNNYTDALCKNREITPQQYSTWTHPRCCL